MAEKTEVTVRHEPFELLPRRGRMLDWVFEGDWPRPLGLMQSEALAVDISRKDGDLIVRASIPGFEAKEINVEVNDGVLSISAEQQEASEQQGERFYRRERRSASSSRVVSLPEAVAEDKVTAEFKNGVLTVSAPVAEKPKANKIPVQGA